MLLAINNALGEVQALVEVLVLVQVPVQDIICIAIMPMYIH